MIRYLLPTIAFTLVAVASFSIWAFGGKLLPSTAALYTGCAVVFFVLGGVSLLPFSGRDGMRVQWSLLWLFPVAFAVYAICWSAGWFTFKNRFGEIAGSIVGIFAMTAVLRTKLYSSMRLLEAAAVVFLFYTAGYYAGEMWFKTAGGLQGKLGWGACYGAGLGAGLVYLIQQSAESRN